MQPIFRLGVHSNSLLRLLISLISKTYSLFRRIGKLSAKPLQIGLNRYTQTTKNIENHKIPCLIPC